MFVNQEFDYWDCGSTMPKEYVDYCKAYLFNNFIKFESSFLESVFEKFNYHLAPTTKYLTENYKFGKDGKIEFYSLNDDNSVIIDYTIQRIEAREITPFTSANPIKIFDEEIKFINIYNERRRKEKAEKICRFVRMREWIMTGHEVRECPFCFEKFFPDELLCL
jgi:hypothetical protein